VINRGEEMGNLKTVGRCPKCGGNLYLDRDYNGWYEQCLQCAYMKDLQVVYQKNRKVEKEATGAVTVKKQGIMDTGDAAVGN
jgi:DNA-directed RNA polymerase subunit M/transcription elongation factor TFIIS